MPRKVRETKKDCELSESSGEGRLAQGMTFEGRNEGVRRAHTWRESIPGPESGTCPGRARRPVCSPCRVHGEGRPKACVQQTSAKSLPTQLLPMLPEPWLTEGHAHFLLSTCHPLSYTWEGSSSHLTPKLFLAYIFLIFTSNNKWSVVPKISGA